MRLRRAAFLAMCLFGGLGVLALGGCSFAATQPHNLGRGILRFPATPTPTPTPPPRPPTPTVSPVQPNPVRLVISSVGINAPVEAVGVESDGDLATPTRSPWKDVGWYSAGPRPGERGSAVIDGHVDGPQGSPAVFWRLGEVRVGDKVLVTDATGTTWTFHVTRLAYYHPQDAPLQDIFGNKGGTYLNLITCAGDWIPSQHQTALRLVVYTALG